MGVAVMNKGGFDASLYYLAAYYFMNLGAFGFLLYFHGVTGKETYESLKGMGYRAPLISIAMVVFLISLTGIPPSIGFYGKLKLFYAVFDTYGWLVVIAGLNSVISLFYYIKVARYLFLFEPSEQKAVPQPLFVGLIAALAVLTVGLGLYLSPLEKWVAASLDIL
jgi:NADH-quinone oxidoreductase subunit N